MTVAHSSAATSKKGSSRRLAVGLVLAAVGLGSVFYAPAFTVVVLVIAVGCLWELARLAERKGQTLDFPVAVVIVVAYIVLAALGLLGKWERVLLAATIVGVLVLSIFGSRTSYFARSAYTLLGVLYIGKLMSYFVTIRIVPEFGVPFTLLAVILIAVTDIASMAVGMSLGRTPLSPVSPRKTVEGALGGLVVATGLGIAFAMTPALRFPWWEGAVIGALTSVGAQVGDLVESALKRDARVKDAGTAIGEHGGVLDRFDSYLFGGITFYGALHLTGHLPGIGL